MTKFFDKLGLSPQERRLVVIVGIIVFVVINWWVILPMFGDWGRYEQRRTDAEKLVNKYNEEIRRQGEYDKRLKELQKSGSEVASEEAALRLQQEVISQANLTGLGYGTITPVNRSGTVARTNAFFDEASVNVSINTGEKELVDFLVRLADKDLLIRAKSMDIGPDPSQTRLQGNLTLVKSFQRKPPPKPAAVPGVAPRPSGGTPAAAPPTGGKPAAAAAPAPAPAPAVAATAAPAAAKPEARPPGIPGVTNSPGRALPKPLK